MTTNDKRPPACDYWYFAGLEVGNGHVVETDGDGMNIEEIATPYGIICVVWYSDNGDTGDVSWKD